LRWFPLTAGNLRGDLIAGISVSLVLIPQAMAYASLAGLPVVYGLYASFLPVIVASMWGASRFLHTGPVAMLSLMSAAALEPLASRGSEEFIQYSMTLALMVGVLRLALGAFRMGVLINFASHPVINGFTNAAALIIGLSLLNTFINVPMPRSDMFLRDLWQVLLQLPLAHWPTIAFGVGTLATLMLLKKYTPRAPGVLIVVVVGTVLSASIGYEKNVLVTPDQIENPIARAAFIEYATLETAFVDVKRQQAALRKQISALPELDMRSYQLQAESLRLLGEERSLKEKMYGHRVEVYRYPFVAVAGVDGKTIYRLHESSFVHPSWHFVDAPDGKFKLSAGGKVVGKIPAGLPTFAVPQLDPGVMSGLLGTALVMALIGFMEATSISRALAAQSRDKLDSNQELIGQGIANIVGSFFHSYVVSGSFSRSAVAARSGARTGLYAVISAIGVVITMLFMTEYFYYLPQPVLAAIVMSAVFGLIDFKTLRQAWKVNRTDGLIGLVTFAATLWMAPQLANGVLVGVVLTVLIFLQSIMQPRSEVMGINAQGVLAGATSNNLQPISPNYAVMRFDGSLVFINSAWFEEAIMRTQAQYPDARAILILGDGINSIDATGEDKLRALVRDLKRADVTLMFSSLKKPVRDVMKRSGLEQEIGTENLFASKSIALTALAARYGNATASTAEVG
jgi:Sulfate permease and related transporters (MFS superfamily)